MQTRTRMFIFGGGLLAMLARAAALSWHETVRAQLLLAGLQPLSEVLRTYRVPVE